MTEVQFLKKCIDIAEGFKFIAFSNYIDLKYQNIVFSAPHSKIETFIFPAEVFFETDLLYPFLIQAAIEGIEDDSFKNPYVVFHHKRYGINFDIYKNNNGKYKSIIWHGNYDCSVKLPELKKTKIEAKEYCLKEFFSNQEDLT
ncbi:MAG: hypothetical protein KAT14_07835 [Candidatus Marinimicrobia bacterium]|nr:hypothetical protein [Candidatus Neomarinimicrobiota bacterium]